MFRDFFRYFKNFFKYKLFRIIIYIFIAFCIFTAMKIKSNAASLPSATATVYTQSQNCTSSNGQLDCMKGSAYKFQYQYNTQKSVDEYEKDIILNNFSYNQLFQNLIYDYQIPDTFTIDSTNRSIYIEPAISSSQFILGNGTGSSNTTFTMSMFPTTSYDEDNETTDRHLIFPINYNFKPYYCSYVDVSDNLTKPCEVILDIGSGNVWKYVANIPLNTTINRLSFYFGTTNLYSGNSKTITYGNYSFQVPDSSYIGYYHNTTAKDLLSIYYLNYNTYRQASNSNNFGLWYLPQGVTIRVPKFNVPNSSTELSYNSNNYTNNTYKWNFTNLTSQEIEILNNSISNIESDIENQNSNQNWFDDTMNGFRSSEEASSFTNLFTALFSYPFQKLSSLSNEPLFTNQGGPNLAVCTGRNLVGGIPENRLEIPVLNNVKWQVPCLHTDFYTQLKSGDFAFYPTTIDGVTITSGGSNSLYPIIRLILRGVLVYILFLNVIDIYKYILDSDRKEIETLDL